MEKCDYGKLGGCSAKDGAGKEGEIFCGHFVIEQSNIHMVKKITYTHASTSHDFSAG